MSGSAIDVEDLILRLGGRVQRPGDDGYVPATSPKNSSGTQQPAAVVRAGTARDVADCVAWTAEHGGRLVVQATGHGAAGAVGADEILLDTSELTAVQISDGRAAVGAGTPWSEINARAQRAGMLGLSGTAPDVGVSGYTFHGGLGWLTRAHGLASSRLQAVEFVDGTGTLRRADEDDDTEALWAFRGGGGVGVATAVEFDLVPVADLHAGFLLWPMTAAERVVGAWAQAVGRLPPSVTSSVGLLKAPDGPMVEEPLRGQRVVHLSLACLDDPDGAAALLEALPAAAQDTFGPCDAARLGQIHLDPPVAVPALGTGLWLDESAAARALTILGATGLGQDATLAEVELRHVEAAGAGVAGAMTTAPGAFVLHATGAAPDADARAAARAALATITEEARPSMTGRGCPSYCDGQTEVLDTYDPATARRLRQIATAIDPAGTVRPMRRLYP